MDREIERAVAAERSRAMADLIRYVSQPSISAQNVGMTEAADIVAELLASVGCEVQKLPTNGPYPVVFGSVRGRRDTTLLFYDHYDVQPPEPLDLWESPPFRPTERDGKLFGRGVSDNKANLVSRVAALRALRLALGDLPISVKFVVEGEEEVGSPNLPAFVEGHRSLLAADACIWEGGGVDWDGAPQVVLGLKGILSFDNAIRHVAAIVQEMARETPG